MKEVKISVVMSVYNGECHLRDAIESILSQTFKDFEFIIIDDGSTDSSADIVRSYDDTRIKLIQQNNAGLPTALNKGIELAAGEYVARMDADDISAHDRLKIQFDFMNEHDDIGILGGHAFLIDEQGVEIGKKEKPTTPVIIHRALEYACPVIHPTYMVRTSVYHKLNGYRSFFSAGQDYDFLLRAYDSGVHIANIDKYLLCYRMNTKCSSPARVRFQMCVTRIALRLHQQRVKYGQESPGMMTDVAERLKPGVSTRFSLAYKYRTKLQLKAYGVTGIYYKIMMLMVVVFSLVDYELFCSSLRGFHYKRICSERKNI